jgi:hypothetical protein
VVRSLGSERRLRTVARVTALRADLDGAAEAIEDDLRQAQLEAAHQLIGDALAKRVRSGREFARWRETRGRRSAILLIVGTGLLLEAGALAAAGA